MKTIVKEKLGPGIQDIKGDGRSNQQDNGLLVNARSATIAWPGIIDERGTLQWGGLAGIAGAFFFILTAIILLGFSSAPDDPEGLIQSYPHDRAAIAVGELTYLAAIILWAIMFLGLYRALYRKSAAPALFGTGIGLIGLISLAVGALPNIAFSVISDLYHAPGATAEEQAQLVQIWNATQGIFNETDTVGFILMALGFVILGMAMLRSPAFGKCYGMTGMVLGVVVATGMLIIGVDSILSFPFVLTAFIVIPIVFGWNLLKLSKINGPKRDASDDTVS